MNNQFLSKRLALLKNKGFYPKVIYDIGAFQGHWSHAVSQTFQESEFYLFEANTENRPILEKQPFPFFLELLRDEEKEMAFYCKESPCTGESIFCEQSSYFQQNPVVRRVKMKTLASVVEANKLPQPDLVKVDVQGAELAILQGSKELIQSAEAVILETKILEYNLGAPLGHELIAYMSELGYRILDILELHYLQTGELNEVDYLFVKSNSRLIAQPPFSV